MAAGNSKWIHKKYPQNIIIKNPFLGMLIFLGFIVIFVIIYKPLQVHESRFFTYQLTIAIYCLILAIPLIGLVKLLKSIRYFSDSSEWTILKEILSIAILLMGMGISVYFLGFFLEIPEQRWNLSTFLNSLISAFLIGIVPFMFFTLISA